MIESNKIRMNRESRERFWKNECDLFNSQGGNVQAFCKERDLGYSTFCKWVKLFNSQKKSPQKNALKNSNEVRIPVLRAPALAAQQLQVEIDGFRLNFNADSDPKFIASILLSIRTGQC